MKFRTGIALAAVAVTLASPQAVMARTAAPSTAQQLHTAQEEIDLLKQQLAALQARLDQMDAANAQAQAQAQAASARADEALAQANTATTAAQTASTNAQAANDQAGKATKMADASKWAADTKVSGRMYFNMSAVNASDAAGNKVESDGGFRVTRVYLGVDHKFDNTFAANVTTDVSSVSGVGQTLYIKKAYLEAKLNPALTLRLGSADTPWVPYAEGIEGHRHIEKELIDLDGFGTSADWGVHASGKFADGLISYQVSAVNGSGYRDPKFSKSVDFEGRVSLEYKGINAAIGGYTGKLGKDLQGVTVYHTANRFNALLAYKGKAGNMPFTVGGEYFYAKNWKQVTSVAEDSSDGYSLFATLSPTARWSLFGRYDWINPSNDLNPTQKDNFYQFGVQFSPAKIVDLALVYKRDDAAGGLKIGNLGTGQATRDEIGLYGQFRF